MENGKKNSLNENDILEGIRTLNAIYSAMMIGSQVAIEKFMVKKKMPQHARKFFISEMVRSLDQIPDVRQQLKQVQTQKQAQKMKVGQKGGISFPKLNNPFKKQTVTASANGSGPATSAAALQLPLDATQPAPLAMSESIPVAEPVVESESEINNNNGTTDDDGPAETQQQMENEVIDSMISSKMMLGKSIFKKIVQVSSNIVERIIDYATGGILNKPPAELVGETNKIILVLSMVLKDLSTDERQIQAMKDISEALTKTFLDVMDVIAPAIKQIVSKTFDNISSIGMQGATGSMRVFISMSKAAISEIPIVGGIINLILAFGESFNVFSKIVSTFMTRGSHMSNDVVNTFMQARAKFEESFARHKREIDKARSAMNTLTNPVQSTVDTIEQVIPPTLETDQSESQAQAPGGFWEKRKQNQVANTIKATESKAAVQSDKARGALEKAQNLEEAEKARQEAILADQRAKKARAIAQGPTLLNRLTGKNPANEEPSKGFFERRRDESAQKSIMNAQQKASLEKEKAEQLALKSSQLTEAEQLRQKALIAKREADLKAKAARGPGLLNRVFTRKQQGGKSKGNHRKTKKMNKYKLKSKYISKRVSSKYKSKLKRKNTIHRGKPNKYLKNKTRNNNSKKYKK